MPQEIRLWRILGEDRLEECRACALDLEQRLETWLECDIGVLSPGLLTIGRQVPTDFGGFIDLLCMDGRGDLVVVELKRAMTPREVTAQALDYASWVEGVSVERITEIANAYLGERGPLEEAYARKFNADLPDVLNENHSILVVASEIDASTERIIRYLSESHGVNINAAKFSYIKTPEGLEILARVFLVDPGTVQYKATTGGSSHRRRRLTYEELEAAADEQGVGDLYRQFVQGLQQFFAPGRTRSSRAFRGHFGESKRTIFSLVPQKSSSEDGLYFELYFQRICEFFHMAESEVLALLPAARQDWSYGEGMGPEWSGYCGYFKTSDEAGRFIDGVVAASAAGQEEGLPEDAQV